MAVQCAHCGEELLGSVNRCWHCGQVMVAHAGPADVPPVRRSAIPDSLNAPLAAMLLEMPGEENQAPRVRIGSPFATAGSSKIVSQRPAGHPLAIATAVRTSNIAPRVAGAASIAMGVIALAVAYPFSPGALPIAAAGIGFGIWGMYSEKRVPGSIGLILCCIALAVSAFLLTTEIFQYMTA